MYLVRGYAMKEAYNGPWKRSLTMQVPYEICCPLNSEITRLLFALSVVACALFRVFAWKCPCIPQREPHMDCCIMDAHAPLDARLQWGRP